MKILLCPDKFKGSLSAQQVCSAIVRGLPNTVQPLLHPMADGGDGSLEVLARHLDLKPQPIAATDPLGRPLQANYFTAGQVAFIELASASGLVLLQPHEHNPLLTSTWGSGLQVVDAIAQGCRQIYLFLGGSATTDGGMGIASALGFVFLDAAGNPLSPTGGSLQHVTTIHKLTAPNLQQVSITLLCDVDNPLYGPNGAAHVYAQQKGANPQQIAQLDEGLRHFSDVLLRHTGIDVSTLPGSGAAGGIGASLVALLGATLQNGFDTIATLTGLEANIQAADWVISGEGKLDAQSLQGKVVAGVAALCRKHGKLLTLFVGHNELDALTTQQLGIRAVHAVTDIANDLPDAMQHGAAHLEALARGLNLNFLQAKNKS